MAGSGRSWSDRFEVRFEARRATEARVRARLNAEQRHYRADIKNKQPRALRRDARKILLTAGAYALYLGWLVFKVGAHPAHHRIAAYATFWFMVLLTCISLAQGLRRLWQARATRRSR